MVGGRGKIKEECCGRREGCRIAPPALSRSSAVQVAAFRV
jgi:hypothetical protein